MTRKPRFRALCSYPGCASAATVVLEYAGGPEVYCSTHFREIYVDDNNGVVPLPIRSDATASPVGCGYTTYHGPRRLLGRVSDGYEHLLREYLDRRRIEMTDTVWCPVCERAYPSLSLRVMRSQMDGTDFIGCASEECPSRTFYPWLPSHFPRSVNPEYDEHPEPFEWYPVRPPRCIAISDDGEACGRAARFMDAVLGGSVCERHRSR